MSMNVDYKGVETGILPADASSTFVAGYGVKMGTDGKVTVPSADKRVLGLVKENRISGVVDEISGGGGIYGSGEVSVLTQGVATVQSVVYNGTSYAVYDTTKTYVADDVIFATPSTGVLTNVAPAGVTSDGLTSVRIGRVLKAPTNPANGDPMTITVSCGN